MLVEVSLGEVLDKLSILEIKKENITDSNKLSHILKEYNYLFPLLEKFIDNEHYIQLKKVNLNIWNLCEDTRIPNIESKQYINNIIDIVNYNDARFRIKNKLNILFDSNLKEQKSYQTKIVEYELKEINHKIILEIKNLSIFNDKVIIHNINHIDKNLLTVFQSDPNIFIH